ncbi:hypothetical protein Ddye_012141 [Dipteronia dyeriana]|uniref:Uncharacterized protein n=1 Tax=Dipteronia dyeriana TaxID=168575 RepID=A0AAE0CI88_9ROSI|nr:hypothetical protein Ddye_012141 [Dipteronia dyeriana]
MQIRTYKNKHLCHRLYRSEEAGAKWIASKYGTLAKNNPDIKSGVISDLLRDQYNVTIDVHIFYNAKKRRFKCWQKEHEESFKHLRKYANMVQQCNPSSAAHLYLLEPTTTFQRFFLSFEAQKNDFMEGCRHFIWD